MILKDDEIHIWRYTFNEKEGINKENSAMLSKKEIERSEDFLNEDARIKYINNHSFVRKVLAKYLNCSPADIEFSHSALGKPFIKNSELFFNYSYRNNFGLLAISRSYEVGVDIEKIKPLQDPQTFIAYSFSEKEKEIIYKSNEKDFEDTLFTFWTFKEAIIKAIGVGLNTDISLIDLSPFLNTASNPLPFDNYSIYTLKRIAAPLGYKAAFAIKTGSAKLFEFEFIEN